jgi:hypothetical protein
VVPKKFSFAPVGCLNETLYWPSFVRFYVHGVGGEGRELNSTILPHPQTCNG